MPTDLNALHVFVKVVETGSFTGAARALGMPKSTVSQRVSELEACLGARLLHRTTRRSSLTDQGRVYYDHCVRIFAEVEEADRAVTSLQETPRGLLRITVPPSTPFLAPVLIDFMERWRELRLEVLYSARLVNLVEESFDIAIRAGALSDSSLMARNLGTVAFIPVASPRYLKEHGRPRSPRDLAKHRCLTLAQTPKTWRLIKGNETKDVEVISALAANDIDILHIAAVRGVGVAILPAYRCGDDLRAKRLERILPDWDVVGEPIHALYPSGRHLSPKVKALLDHLQQMTTAPWTTSAAPAAVRRPSRRRR